MVQRREAVDLVERLQRDADRAAAGAFGAVVQVGRVAAWFRRTRIAAERVLAEVERPLLRLVLSATRGNQIKAAEILGVNRNTLRAKIRSLDIPLHRG